MTTRITRARSMSSWCRARADWATPVRPAPGRAASTRGPAGAVAGRVRRARPVRGGRRGAGPLALPRPARGGHPAARPGRRARSTPWSAARCATACCAASRCASCTSRRHTETVVVRRSTATPSTCPPATSPLEYALALGVGRGLSRPLPGADGLGAGRRADGDDDVLWMPVPPGSVQYGVAYGAEAAADLLVDPGDVAGHGRPAVPAAVRPRPLDRAAGAHATRTVRRPVSRRVRPSAPRPTGRCWRRSASRRRSARPPPTSTTPRTRPAGWSPTRPGSRSPSPRRAAPRATGSTRSSGSRSPPASAPGPSGSTGAGGATTSARWSATAACPAHRSRCCGGAAATWPCTPRRGARHRWRRRTRRSSRSGR